MQRARRVALVAVLALVGGLALAGCRSQPGAAIYVGAARYSQKQVDGLADQATKLGYPRGYARNQVAQWLVVRDLGKRIVAEKALPAPSVDVAGVVSQAEQSQQVQATAQQDAQKSVEAKAKAAGEKLSDDELQKRVAAETQTRINGIMRSIHPLIQLVAEYSAYNDAVQQQAAPVQPTDADYADLHKRAKAASLVDPSQDVATFRQGLNPQIQQAFARYLGARKLYADAIKRANVVINPKYGPVDFSVWDQQGEPLVVLPLNKKTSTPGVVPAPGRTEAPAATS